MNDDPAIGQAVRRDTLALALRNAGRSAVLPVVASLDVARLAREQGKPLVGSPVLALGIAIAASPLWRRRRHRRHRRIGIPADALGALFQPSRQVQQRRSRGGSGRERAISQRIVEAMGGRIEASSPPGLAVGTAAMSTPGSRSCSCWSRTTSSTARSAPRCWAAWAPR